MKELCYDQKWHRFLRKLWLFKYVPFVERVYASGSLVLNGPNQRSDFDVLVVTGNNRLWTARFFCLLIFKILGLRPNRRSKSDKFCFNHFVTSDGFPGCLTYNSYSRLLKDNLVLVWESLKNSGAQVDLFEKIFRQLQFWKIKGNIKKFSDQNSLIILKDNEVQLCFNPREQDAGLHSAPVSVI